MNPYYYLFYKINRILNKKGDNEMGPIFGVTVLIGWNFALIYNKTSIVNMSIFESHKPYIIVFVITIFIINIILFSNKKRVNRIEERYKNESKMHKITGNVVVLIYVILTSTAVFF